MCQTTYQWATEPRWRCKDTYIQRSNCQDTDDLWQPTDCTWRLLDTETMTHLSAIHDRSQQGILYWWNDRCMISFYENWIFKSTDHEGHRSYEHDHEPYGGIDLWVRGLLKRCVNPTLLTFKWWQLNRQVRLAEITQFVQLLCSSLGIRSESVEDKTCFSRSFNSC